MPGATFTDCIGSLLAVCKAVFCVNNCWWHGWLCLSLSSHCFVTLTWSAIENTSIRCVFVINSTIPFLGGVARPTPETKTEQLLTLPVIGTNCATKASSWAWHYQAAATRALVSRSGSQVRMENWRLNWLAKAMNASRQPFVMKNHCHIPLHHCPRTLCNCPTCLQ